MSNEKAQELTVLNNIKENIKGMADCMFANECDDFIEQLPGFHWNEDLDKDVICNAMNEIVETLNEKSAADGIAIIRKYVGTPQHILMDILKTYVLVETN